MPTYRAPGIYAEEIAGLPRSIAARETRTAVLVGPAAHGPLDELSDVCGSLRDFERLYGAPSALDFGRGVETVNWLAHAARAFFDEGGVRLRIVRCRGGEGHAPALADYRSAFGALAATDAMITLAAPGGTRFPGVARGLAAELVRVATSGHPCCFALLDTDRGESPREARARAGAIDADRAALYYPWVLVDMPAGRVPLPPSAFLSGIIQRVDARRGVHKSPANVVVRSASGLERRLSPADLGALTRAHVNCLRDFGTRGIRVWGARTLSSDPEWRYLAVRRLVMHVADSVEHGLDWVRFESNGAQLWSEVRTVISNFLVQQWRAGAVRGTTPDEACFVRCGRDTMTQADVDAGRLIVELGLAPLRPAEFVVIRLRLDARRPAGSRLRDLASRLRHGWSRRTLRP